MRALQFSSLVLALELATQSASAAEYLVSSQSDYEAAITAANADPDPDATLRLTGNVALSGPLSAPTPTKPITIDTQGFTLTSATATTILATSAAAPLVLNGTYAGAAGSGVSGVSVSGSGGQLTNNGSVTGGAQTGAAGGGGAGIAASPGVRVVNNGSIKGGTGAAGFNASNTTLSAGVSLGNSASLFNSTGGVIEGGDVSAGTAGNGVSMSVTTGGSIVNQGTIRGGKDLSNGLGGGHAIRVASGPVTIENSGLLEGGKGNAAIYVQQNARLTIINSGSIHAGDGYANAIEFGTSAAPTNTATLELQAGSDIVGNVIAGAGSNDILRLGGSGNALFNVADIGSTAQYRNFDILEKTGSSTWTLIGNGTDTTPWTVKEGTLAVDGSIASPVNILADGTLSGSGTVSGTVTNAGAITPGGGSGTLTIDGNYIGNGGVIRVNSALGNDASATGRLVITGDTSGTSTIAVTNRGGLGGQTVEGIKLIDVQGLSNGVFSLAGDYTFRGQPAVVAGAYAYRLYKNGITNSTDGDWYLRSTLDDTQGASAAPLLAPTVALYESYASVLQRVNQLGTLHDRVGNRYWQPDAEVQAEPEAGLPAIGRGAWVRVEGDEADIDPATSTTGAHYDVRSRKLEAGFDVPVYQGRDGTLVLSPTLHYGKADSSVSSLYGDGSIDVTGYGFGGTATWYGSDGTYVDGQASVSRYDSDLRSSQLGRKLVEGNRGHGVGTSLEVGHRLVLDERWSLTPQAQLSWSRVRFEHFSDPYGADISQDAGNSLVSRLGLMLDRTRHWKAADGTGSGSRVYGITNLYYDLRNGTSADVSDVHLRSREQPLWAGLGVGASLSWDNDRSSLFAELQGRTSLQDFGDSHSIGAKIGARMMW